MVIIMMMMVLEEGMLKSTHLPFHRLMIEALFYYCFLFAILQDMCEQAMGTYKYIGRFRSARMIGLELAEFYM